MKFNTTAKQKNMMIYLSIVLFFSNLIWLAFNLLLWREYVKIKLPDIQTNKYRITRLIHLIATFLKPIKKNFNQVATSLLTAFCHFHASLQKTKNH